MNEKFVAAKNYVAARKTTILVTALVVTTTVVVLQNAGIQSHNQFLKDHDLYDTYYTSDED